VEQPQQLVQSGEAEGEEEGNVEAIPVQQHHEEEGLEWSEQQQQQQQQQQPKRRLLQGSSRRRLPGEYGGGEASDVVCDSTTLSYTAQIGPLGPKACGQYKVGERPLSADVASPHA
jgi:hypothetical protein